MTATKDMTTQKFVVELRKIDDITPYDRNPRINEGAVDAVAESLRQFGFRQPIVIDAAGVIIAGHTRWKAAQKLGLAKVPVHVAAGLTDEQVRAYRIADNKTGELAEWDFEILPIEIAELAGGGIDLEALGFGGKELAQLLSDSVGVSQGLTDADAVPEPPDDPITQPGDIWILGNHRLMCGDSGSQADLDRLLDGATIDLVAMDPPYNVRVEPRSNNAIAAGLSSFTSTATHHQKFDVERHPEKAKGNTKKMRAKDRPLENDFVSEEAFDRMLLDWFGNVSRVLKPGGSFYIWGGYANLGNYPAPLKASGLYFSQGIVWDKQHPVLTRKDMMGAFEIAFYGWREGAGHHFYGPNNATDLWHVKKVNPQSMVHLTEKPVELAVRSIQYSSKVGDKATDGEVFAALAANPWLDSPIELDIQLVEADRVTSPTMAVLPVAGDVDGIHLDTWGNPAAYTVLRYHPGEIGAWRNDYDLLDAADMIHYFRADRPGQHRGVPEITPALPLFAQLRRYTLAVLGAAETAADFAAVLYTDAPADGQAAAVEPMDIVELEKRMATTLPDGWKLGQIKAEQPGTTYGEFKRELLNEIARCLNLPYNIAACNSSGYNYASGRLDHQTYYKSIRVEQAHMGDAVLDRIFDAWYAEAMLTTDLSILRTVRSMNHQWFFDGTEHVDPAKEANAQATRLGSHTTTLAIEYARQGRDWETELRQRAKEKQLMDELGLGLSQERASAQGQDEDPDAKEDESNDDEDDS